jgi:putative spermidine/putrescine transport system permease protein
MASQALPLPQQPKAPRTIASRLVGYALVAPPLLLMGLLIFYPALQSLVRTLVIPSDSGGTSLSLERYIHFFRDPISVSNLVFTIAITLMTVGLLFVVCFPIAVYLRFSRSRIAAWVQVLTLFPLFVPSIILAFAMIRFLGTHGTLDTLLHAVGLTGYRQAYLKPQGIVIGLLWDNLPFTTLILTAGLRQIDDAVIESARDVGASSWQVFRRIILPLVQRPALIVLCLNFLGIFGAYTLPYLLGPAAPQMMGPYMQRTFQDMNDINAAETEAVITFLVCSVVGMLYIRSVTRQRLERT